MPYKSGVALTRAELARLVADGMRVSPKDTDEIIERSLDYIVEALTNLRIVQFRGFGTFSVRVRSARVGRSPHPVYGDSSVVVEIPKHYAIKFKPARRLRAALIRKPVS